MPLRKPHSLIIGGTRGIGRALAQVLAAEGHAVSVIGRSIPAAKPAGGICVWPVDLLDRPALSRSLGEIISRNGKLNNLIFLQRYKADGDKWTGEIETALSATRFVIESLLGKFNRGEKSIVLVSSAASDVVADEQGVGYHVAKAGLNQLGRYYAVTLGPRGIRVNTVSPGTVLKLENENFYRKNKRLQNLFKRTIPLGRMGTAEEIANVIAFLCSSKASFITGQTLRVDGGVNLLSTETLARKLTRNL
jgi:NAD(P)-dependent dehydrogenase (short-subunit alcohol dehydrogenase family)